MTRNLIATLIFAGGTLVAQSGAPGYDPNYNGDPTYNGAYDDGVPSYYAPAPPVAQVDAYQPPCPGDGYVWVNGYWNFVGGRYAWVAGYWTPPPFLGSSWVAPRYVGGRYYAGYWGGNRAVARDRFVARDQFVDRGRFENRGFEDRGRSEGRTNNFTNRRTENRGFNQGQSFRSEAPNRGGQIQNRGGESHFQGGRGGNGSHR